MIPAAFAYHAPKSLTEATALLAKLGDGAKVLSGGQSLIPLMKLRLTSPPHVVDINGIQGLAYLKEADGFLRIGALTSLLEPIMIVVMGGGVAFIVFSILMPIMQLTSFVPK